MEAVSNIVASCENSSSGLVGIIILEDEFVEYHHESLRMRSGTFIASVCATDVGVCNMGTKKQSE